MRAICVTAERTLELRDVPTPAEPAPGHVLVEMDSATITHGDKFFLSNPLPNGAMSGGRYSVYGSNGAGRVAAIGQGVPGHFVGRQVGVYKTLRPSDVAVGMWCDIAHVPYQSCLVLPDDVRMRDYNGSFANVLTVYAFFAQIVQEGHKGVIVTAGNSATGLIAAALAPRFNLAAVFLVRSATAKAALVEHGVEHVLVTTDADFDNQFAITASALGTTAVFDGVGGELLGRIMPGLPMNGAIFVYGFLGAAAQTTFPSTLIISKNIVIRRFSNLESPTVRKQEALRAAIAEMGSMIGNQLLKTRIGKEFRLDQHEEAMSYQGTCGRRPVLIF